MKKLYLVISIMTVLGLVIICAIPIGSPIQRTCDRAIDSANAHDYAKFCQYIDVKGLIESYLKISNEKRGCGLTSTEPPENSDDIEKSIEYFINTEQIPNPDRFRKIFSTKINGDYATAMIALDVKHYSVVCTTFVSLRLLKSRWQITEVDFERVWNKVRRSEKINPYLSGQIPLTLTPKNIISEIIFDVDI
jgi:hypothetical protein